MNTIALIAAAGLGASAASASVTFDLSGISIDAATPLTLMMAASGSGNVVSGIDYSIDYGPATGSLSWSEELAIELVAPGASADGFGPAVGDGAADGNIHFGSTPESGFNAARDMFADVLLGGSGTTGVGLSAAGSTSVMDGTAGDGTWTLIIGEIFDDTGMDGTFGAGSFITVNFVPAPGAAALFGLGGLAAARRRR